MERKFEVRTFMTYRYCSDCRGFGKMIPTGNGRGSKMWGAKYEHKCVNCGKTEDFDKVYPQISYEEIQFERLE